MPLASVITGCQRLLRRVARSRKQQPHLAQVFARLGKPRPALVHHVVVGKRNNLDPAGLQRLGQRHRRVEHERLRSLRVLRSHRRLQVDEPEIRALENVAHIAEQRSPALRAACRSIGRRPHRLMRNHVAGNRKAHPGKVVRIGCRRSQPAAAWLEHPVKYATPQRPAQAGPSRQRSRLRAQTQPVAALPLRAPGESSPPRLLHLSRMVHGGWPAYVQRYPPERRGERNIEPKFPTAPAISHSATVTLGERFGPICVYPVSETVTLELESEPEGRERPGPTGRQPTYGRVRHQAGR